MSHKLLTSLLAFTEIDYEPDKPPTSSYIFIAQRHLFKKFVNAWLTRHAGYPWWKRLGKLRLRRDGVCACKPLIRAAGLAKITINFLQKQQSVPGRRGARQARSPKGPTVVIHHLVCRIVEKLKADYILQGEEEDCGPPGLQAKFDELVPTVCQEEGGGKHDRVKSRPPSRQTLLDNSFD